MPCSVASDLGNQCLSLSPKKTLGLYGLNKHLQKVSFLMTVNVLHVRGILYNQFNMLYWVINWFICFCLFVSFYSNNTIYTMKLFRANALNPFIT